MIMSTQLNRKEPQGKNFIKANMSSLTNLLIDDDDLNGMQSDQLKSFMPMSIHYFKGIMSPQPSMNKNLDYNGQRMRLSSPNYDDVKLPAINNRYN